MSTLAQITQIINSITIEQPFTVSHPEYPSLNLSSSLIEQFNNLSIELQDNYLISQIQTYIYDIYFTNSAIKSNTEESSVFNHNQIAGLDVKFIQELNKHNLSNGYLDHNWQISSIVDEKILMVVKDGLHLYIKSTEDLPKEFQSANIGDLVSIYLPKNLVGINSYIAVSNYGCVDRASAVEIYFNISSSGILAIESALIDRLNHLQIPFELAILDDPTLFYRYDGAVLSIPKNTYPLVFPLLQNIYQTYAHEFSSTIPLFTKQLAPGLGLMEIPQDVSNAGMNLCGILAKGLLKIIKLNVESIAEKITIIQDEFKQADINLNYPFLNGRSIDEYQLLI